MPVPCSMWQSTCLREAPLCCPPALMTVMVNARHLFYGVSMIERYKDTGKAKPYLIFALTDETYSLVCSGETPEGGGQKTVLFPGIPV